MRRAACVSLLLLTASGSTRPPQPKAAAADQKAAYQGKIRAGHLGEVPRLIHHVRPVYPKEAKEARIQGRVEFLALITKTGHVEEIELVSGNPALVPAALAAVKQWRYTPARLNGEPLDAQVPITVSFSLTQ